MGAALRRPLFFVLHRSSHCAKQNSRYTTSTRPTRMDKKQLSEQDICTKFITPALRQAGWDELTQLREEVSFTKGRIIVRGKIVKRGKPNAPTTSSITSRTFHSRSSKPRTTTAAWVTAFSRLSNLRCLARRHAPRTGRLRARRGAKDADDPAGNPGRVGGARQTLPVPRLHGSPLRRPSHSPLGRWWADSPRQSHAVVPAASSRGARRRIHDRPARRRDADVLSARRHLCRDCTGRTSRAPGCRASRTHSRPAHRLQRRDWPLHGNGPRGSSATRCGLGDRHLA